MAVQGCRPPLGPAALVFLALVGPHAVQALRGAARIAAQQPPASRSYLFHNACPNADGMGGRVRALKKAVSQAVENSLTYVCNPEDFDTHLHSTGNMGFVFGCNSKSDVLGDAASMESVQNLTWELFPSSDGGYDRPTPTVFQIKECKWGMSKQPWGESYKWFRSQYHLVRTADERRRRPECLDPRKKNIVLHIRKGDDPSRSFKAEVYVQLLELIFTGRLERAHISSTEAHIVILSEAEESDPDMVTFRDFFQRSLLPASFFLGLPEQALEPAQARFVRDMDCMSLSDVLVLSDSGFSDVGAVVQQTGVALMLHSLWRRNVGLPNTEKVSKYGQEQVQVAFETSPGELPNQLYVDVSLVSRED